MSRPFASLTKLVPASIKDPVKETLRRRRFERVLAEYQNLNSETYPSNKLLAEFVSAWGNEGYSANTEYLLELVRLVRSVDGPVIECGSGLSTILAGIELQRRNQKIVSLEHHPEWAARMRREVNAIKLSSVEIYEAPLRSYGTFSWYDISTKKLPPRFALVVCDGPPGDTPGGRYGLMPVMRDHLSNACVIMLDDYQRREEQAVAARWASETGAAIIVHGVDKPFALLRLP